MVEAVAALDGVESVSDVGRGIIGLATEVVGLAGAKGDRVVEVVSGMEGEVDVEGAVAAVDVEVGDGVATGGGEEGIVEAIVSTFANGVDGVVVEGGMYGEI